MFVHAREGGTRPVITTYGYSIMATVLAVDDSTSMRRLVAMTLEQAGHQVATAEDGMAALEYARSNAVQLVVTDVHMPNMNGIDLVKHLRELEAYRFTPILVLTTESSSDMKMKGKAAGATGWIVKPFDPVRLLAAIDRVLP